METFWRKKIIEQNHILVRQNSVKNNIKSLFLFSGSRGKLTILFCKLPLNRYPCYKFASHVKDSKVSWKRFPCKPFCIRLTLTSGGESNLKLSAFTHNLKFMYTFHHIYFHLLLVQVLQLSLTQDLTQFYYY